MPRYKSLKKEVKVKGKGWVFGLSLFLVVTLAGGVWAKEKKTATVQAGDDAAVRKLAEKQIIEQGLAAMRAKEWTIYLVPSGQSYGKKIPQQVDVLTFFDGKVSSKNLGSQGYEPSNYTPWLMDNQILVWETMQSNPAGDLVFWRGELRGEVMVGFLSMHSKKGQITEYTFSSNPPAEKRPEQATNKSKSR